MITELSLKLSFLASHSLDVREEQHPHLWKVEAWVGGVPVKGKLINLPTLQSAFEKRVADIADTFLNENAALSADARAFPTCETLSADLFARFSAVVGGFQGENPSLRLLSVMVTLCDPDGREWGSARVRA